MTNQYYNRQTECNPGELADGTAIEAEFDSLQRAFDKLPAPHLDGGGFEVPVRVGAAVSDDEAAQLAQINALLEGFLSKSGNLAGLAAPGTALSNLGVSTFIKTLLDDADAATARTTLGAQASDATLTALAGVTTEADKLIYATAPDVFTTTSITPFARTLIDDVDAAAMRTTLGIDELEPRISDNESKVFEALRRSYADAGYTLVDGSFEEGGTLAGSSDVLLHKATGVAYSWSGVFPKVVAAGSTPATSGGVGAGAWVDRTQDTIRSELNSNGILSSIAYYGAVMDGITDDTNAIKMALATIGHVTIPFGKVVKITSSINIDTKTQSLTSDGAVIDATGVTGEAFRIYSTAATLQERALTSHNKKALYGISLLGVNSPGKLGVVIGKTGSAYVNSNDIEINVGFYGFEKQVVFDDNAWRPKLTKCGFEGGAIPFYFNHPSNAGEVIEFNHCWIVDWTSGPVAVNGNFLFKGCSFIGGATTPMAFDGNAKADFVGCNLEDQVDGGYWLTLNGVAKANFIGGQLLVNSTRTKPLIYKAVGASVHFQGTSLPLYGSNLQYETNVSYGIKARMIVEGSGNRVTAEGCDTIAGTTNDSTIQAVLGGSNLVTNSSFETGNVTGWTLTSYGGTGTLTATSDAATGSSYGGQLTAGASVGCYATQDIDLAGAPGALYSIGMYAKAISGTGTLAYPKLQFFGANGADLGSPFSFAVTSTNTAGIWRAYNGVIPDGAVKATITLDCQQLAGGCSVGYDNIWFQTL